jgi:hypothetical protein
MAQIILITAGTERAGEPQRLSTLGARPAQWCMDKLNLEPDPIPLGTRVELTSSQHVFVKIDQDEKGPLKPGLYPSDRTPTVVRELLREL